MIPGPFRPTECPRAENSDVRDARRAVFEGKALRYIGWMIAGIKRFSRGGAWRLRMVLGLVLWTLAAPARAAEFDYYLLALSWSPSWCAGARDRQDADQCAPDRDFGFLLHGLWPQYETGGWPEFCATARADPSRRETAAMADIMGSAGLAWRQWTKHGRCTGESARGYFDAARAAYRGLALPEPDGAATVGRIVADFVRANPGLKARDLIVTCRDARLAEVRICLTPDLAFRACSPEVRADACRARGALDAPPIP